MIVTAEAIQSTNGDSDHLPGLLPHHVRELRASGLTNETIKAAGIFSETKYENLAAVLDWRKFPKKMAPALVFPFHAADGTNGYSRIKPDRPRRIGGKMVKYESPRGRGNQLYLPPGVAQVLDRPDVELLITEGEKKSLKATQEGFPCLGLVGVYGWKDGKSERLLPAMERIAWKGRPVRLVFDSDITRNENVQEAEARLAKHLADRGATVRVVRLPDGAPDADGMPAKMGLDDFLVAHGLGELRKLLDSALDPVPQKPIDFRARASDIEPCEEIQAYLKLTERDGLPRLRFWRGSWWLWQRGCYVELSNSEIRARIVRHINLTYSHLTTNIVGNVMEQLRAQTMLSTRMDSPAWIDEPPLPWPADEVLAAQNGLIHVPSLIGGQEHQLPATPRFLTTAALDYSFSLEAATPNEWLQFLNQLWPDDRQSIELLQEWCGYLLTPDTRQQKILLLVGPKRSGKGTIARVVRALVGPANVAGPTLAGLGMNFGLWPLLGKSVAIVSDARLSGRTDAAIVVERLLSISGEDALTIERKFLEPVTCKLSARFMVLTNELPRLGDSSGALAGRMILLRMTKSFYGHEDMALSDRLLAERPGILLWAIEGWRRMRERGRFIQPDSAAELMGDLQELSSPIGQFVQECCHLEPARRAAVEDLFDAWRLWCDQKGRREPGTEQTFGRDLLAAVPTLQRVRPRENGERVRKYDGIDLTSDWLQAVEANQRKRF